MYTTNLLWNLSTCCSFLGVSCLSHSAWIDVERPNLKASIQFIWIFYSIWISPYLNLLHSSVLHKVWRKVCFDTQKHKWLPYVGGFRTRKPEKRQENYVDREFYKYNLVLYKLYYILCSKSRTKRNTTSQKLHCSNWHLCLVFRRPRIRTSVHKRPVLTESFRRIFQAVHTTTWKPAVLLKDPWNPAFIITLSFTRVTVFWYSLTSVFCYRNVT
jgi:hypothetical protein